MPTSLLSARAFIALSAAIACTTGTIAPAALASPVESSGGTQVQLLIQLRDDVAAVRRVAHTAFPSRAARSAALQSAERSTADGRARVVSWLEAQGTDVESATAFGITVAADAAVADRLFPVDSDGTRRSSGELAGVAASVISGDDGAGLLHHLGLPTVNGTTARRIYDAPAGKPPAGYVSPQIATLQFSGWDSSDLSAFAIASGHDDPVQSGDYQEISIGGQPPWLADGHGGEFEVALDQEALLAAAPYAPQRAYFAPNSLGYMVMALEEVAGDAADGVNIGALSISYGVCEGYLSSSMRSSLHSAVTDVVAAGVTVFASSGDEGPYCAGDVDVLFPASDPFVVAVGGTRVTDLAATQPSESVWWDGVSGGGTGISSVFPEPAYQVRHAGSVPGRAIPDISLDADPETGFLVYVDGGVHQIGGTSLASPLAAATFVDMLADSGTEYGIGWINPNLYAAPAGGYRDITLGGNDLADAGPGFDFASGLGAPLWGRLHDSLIGWPGLDVPDFSSSRTVPLSVSVPEGMRFTGWRAGVGPTPDTCGSSTGSTPPSSVTAAHDGRTNVWVIGFAQTYCYDAEATVVIDTASPTTTSSSVVLNRSLGRVKVLWGADDPAPGSGIAGYDVAVKKEGAAKPIFKAFGTTRTSKRLVLAKHTTYVVAVRATDRAGNQSQITFERVRV